MNRKFIRLLLCGAIILLISACSGETSPKSAVSDSAVSQTSNYSEDDITVECSDLKSGLGAWNHFALNISHSTDKYLTAEVHGVVYGADGAVLGERTTFVNNLAGVPNDWVSDPFLAKSASSYSFKYEIASYKFTDNFDPSPKIDDSNKYNYLRLTSEFLGDTLGDEMSVTAHIHNLTSQYFTGKITFTVKDSSGEIIRTDSKEYKNVKPYTDSGNLIWFPIANDYTIEYEINEYNFTEAPTV